MLSRRLFAAISRRAGQFASMAESTASIVGLGNPLLDISAHVDQAFLDKYQIKLATQILAEPQHLPMYEELSSKPDVEYIPGGATQNSVRVAQWVMRTPGSTAYFGCIGSDEYGKIMRDSASRDGVDARYQVDDTTPTGTCAVAIIGGERSLTANLGAANNYKVDHVKQPDNWAVVEKAKLIYSAGFFITVSPDAIMATAQHCAEHDKVYAMNLSAPFIMQVPPFKATLLAALPYVDFLFGNETEAATFAETEGWETKDVAEIAKKISQHEKVNKSRPRYVVFTQGPDPTIIAVEGKVTTHDVIKLPKDKLVDTNGAGDAFVGGFLSQIVAGKSIEQAVSAANFAANTVIQRSGCTFPPECTFQEA